MLPIYRLSMYRRRLRPDFPSVFRVETDQLPTNKALHDILKIIKKIANLERINHNPLKLRTFLAFLRPENYRLHIPINNSYELVCISINLN